MSRTNDLIPNEITVSRDRELVRLLWSDGRKASLTAHSLRSACRCAWCTRDRILDRFKVEGCGLSLTQVEALGSHGLHIKFSDGHERGIYPWAYLDDLTQGRSVPPTSGRGAQTDDPQSRRGEAGPLT